MYSMQKKVFIKRVKIRNLSKYEYVTLYFLDLLNKAIFFKKSYVVDLKIIQNYNCFKGHKLR